MAKEPAQNPSPAIIDAFERLGKAFRPTWGKFLIFAFLGLAGGTLVLLFDATAERTPANFAIYSGIGTGVGILYFLGLGVVANSFSRIASATRQQATIQAKSEVLQEAIEEDFFNNLVKINFKYIDKYYLQTQIQADKSFWLTCIAATIGFLVMVAGIVMMYLGKTEAGYVSAGAGLISQFISGVFFYLYNKTIIAMAGYHRKLVLTQNIGLALRITEDLPSAEKTAARIQLVDRLSTEINALLATQQDAALAA